MSDLTTTTAAAGIIQKAWWVFAVRGAAAILFGVMAILWPLLALATFVLLFAAYAFADGLCALTACSAVQDHVVPRWVLVLQGLAGLAVGILAFLNPGLTVGLLYYLFAGWAILVGATEVVGALQLRRQIAGEIFLLITGVLTIVFGVLLFLHPVVGIVIVVYIVGVNAILFGSAMVGLGLRLRRHAA